MSKYTKIFLYTGFTKIFERYMFVLQKAFNIRTKVQS